MAYSNGIVLRSFLFLLPALFLSAADQSSTEPAVAPVAELPDSSCAPAANPPVTVKQMFDFINNQRKRFAPHSPFDGYPWIGKYTETRKWPLQFTWNDDLARKAQQEADRLGKEERPEGRKFRHQLGGLYGDQVEDLWLRGLDSPLYEVVGQSRTGSEPDNAWHASNNGTMRLAVLYQTGTGSHVKKQLGIGKACGNSGSAWWVLLFAD